jgi:hypothetical protein
MSKYTDEERREILDKARNTLKRGVPHTPERHAAGEAEREAERKRELKGKVQREIEREVERFMAKTEPESEPRRERHLTDTEAARHKAELTNLVASERAYLLQEFLPELIAQFHDQITEEIERAYAKQFNIVRLEIDGLRHEIRKFAGAGVIELPSFLGPEQKRAN